MKYIYFLLILLLPVFCAAQSDSARLACIDRKLERLIEADSLFTRSVDISSGKLPLSELLRNIARASGVNLSVRSVDNVPVSCNFTRARVDDLLRFLCREYRLDVDITGNIVSVFPAAIVPQPRPDPNIVYHAADTTLCYDLAGERLIDVARKITDLSGRNILIPQSLSESRISGYIRSMPFDGALSTLASINGLTSEKDASQVWSLYRSADHGADEGTAPAYMRRRQFSENELQVDSLGQITAHIVRGDVQDLILDLCEQLRLNYYFKAPVHLSTGIYVDNTDFETLLGVLLKGSDYSYYCERGIYVFGAAQSDGLAAAHVVGLVFRSVAQVADLIPAALRQGVEIKPFPDLNSLIVSGDNRDVARVRTFVKSIDKPVPMVTMEIIIADVTKSDIKEAGIGAGVGTAPSKTSGTLSPGVDMTFGAGAVNKLLNSFNGFGAVNLGKVTPGFYLSLKLLEENGTVRLQSTPKLSTLNGHEAMLTSGEKQYYKEVQNNYFGTQNPVQSESYTWKSVDANLNIKVTPYVSEDRNITLEIAFEQTEFTGRSAEDAPPATATRSFKSIVKVQNEEMVLLGGLDRNTFEKSSSGIPFLARVPVIKWLFGKSKRNKVERTLNVFIKPTVID